MDDVWLDLGEYRGPSHTHALVMYMAQRRRQRALTQSYRQYVTDSLQLLPQSQCLSRRWSDLIRPRVTIDVDATIEHVLEMIGAEEE